MNKIVITAYLLLTGFTSFAQLAPKPYGALPSKAQLNWHEMEMYCIIHYGVDTYTDKEWGFGDENPQLIDPDNFDAEQIVSAAKAGGFKGIVVVAKHHDGLCLWPTKTTEHNISKTKWKNGQGDMVKEYQLACEKLGMQMGLYCSPWDRNTAEYGKPEYIATYREQIRELYTNYGKLFISWHDGANGGDGFYGGANESRNIDRSTYYGWPVTWRLIRKLQPSAAIFGDVGPDVRWVGNEEGHAGRTSWATYTPLAPDEGKLPSNGYVKYWQGVEGTRNGKYWMPAECDVSLRPGWFYHQNQNSQVKTPTMLLDLYYKSVGRGANLDLGLSPNKKGKLDEDDVSSLTEFGELLKETFSVNLAKGSVLTASNVRGRKRAVFGPQLLLDQSRYTYWSTDEKIKTPTLTLTLAAEKTFNVIRLRENIKLGQRIEAFEVDAFIDGSWKKIASETSIGANRLIRLPEAIVTKQVRLRITKSPVCIALSDFGLYKEPDFYSVPEISRNKKGMLNIEAFGAENTIHYTTDGRRPNLKSRIFTGPFLMSDGGMVRAIAARGNKKSEVVTLQLGVSKFNWVLMADSAGIFPGAAIDENPNTFWSTLSADTAQQFKPASMSVDMGTAMQIESFSYLPRPDLILDGIVDQYTFYTSNDGISWQIAASGEFSNIRANPINQVVRLKNPVSARYFKFSGFRVVKGNGVTAAEIGVSIK